MDELDGLERKSQRLCELPKSRYIKRPQTYIQSCCWIGWVSRLVNHELNGYSYWIRWMGKYAGLAGLGIILKELDGYACWMKWMINRSGRTGWMTWMGDRTG